MSELLVSQYVAKALGSPLAQLMQSEWRVQENPNGETLIEHPVLTQLRDLSESSTVDKFPIDMRISAELMIDSYGIAERMKFIPIVDRGNEDKVEDFKRAIDFRQEQLEEKYGAKSK